MRIPVCIALICTVIFVWCFWGQLSWWRWLLGTILAMTMGHQLGMSYILRLENRERAWKELFGAISILFLVLAVVFIPRTEGWVLLALGYLWPVMTRRILTPKKSH